MGYNPAMARLRARVRFGDAELELEGPEPLVLRQIEAFEARFKHPSPGKDLFHSDEGGRLLSIKAPIPESGELGAAGNAVLLLLLGFKRLHGADSVTALRLAGCVERCGLPSRKLYRVTGRLHRRHLLTQDGSRRGTSYGLTEKGLREAERLLREAQAAGGGASGGG